MTSDDTNAELSRLSAEGSYDSSGVFTLSRQQAVEKLQDHLSENWARVYVLILQWMVGLGCSRIALDIVGDACVISGADPQEDPFQEWPGDDLTAFLAKPRPLDRIRGYWLLELNREKQQPAWVEFWQGTQVTRCEPFQTGSSTLRSNIKHGGLTVSGSKVVVIFGYISMGEDHDRDLTLALQSGFHCCPVPIHLKRVGGLAGMFSNSEGTDLRAGHRVGPLLLPLLLDAYDNRSLGFGSSDARGILLRPPFTMAREIAVVFAHWQNHDLMDTRPTQKDKPVSSMARYFAAASWQYPEEVHEADLGAGRRIYLRTGRGRLAVHCSGGSETDTLLPVMFGVLLPELQGKLGLPGFHVVACADGLATDLGANKLMEGDALATWLGEIRSSLAHLLDLAQQHPPEPGQKVSAAAIPVQEGFNLSSCLTMITLPAALKLGVLIPGLLLSVGYFVAAYKYAEKKRVNSALGWNAQQISDFLQQSRSRIG